VVVEDHNLLPILHLVVAVAATRATEDAAVVVNMGAAVEMVRGRGASNPGGQKQRFNGQCQVCLKEGHNAASCWHRFDADYVPDEKLANTVVHRYGVDSNWYTDTGATDHITSELDKLVIHDKYNGNDQIRTASGAGMNINHIGKAIVSTPNCNLHLNNFLHVPNAKKNLVSVHRLAADNNAFLEFHPNFFLSRIRPRGELLWKASVEEVSIPFLRWNVKLIVPLNPPLQNGIVD
jgi:histone deacetylase 1/2